MSETETSDVEVFDPEVGEIATVHAEPIEPNNPIDDLIDYIGTKQYTDAEKTFNDVMSDRLQDVLDQAKVKLSGQVYNNVDDEEEVDDEELEVEIDDIETYEEEPEN